MVKEIEGMKAVTERPRTWAEHIETATAAGLRLSEYARREGVSVQALYQFRKREKERAQRDGAFVRVMPMAERVAAAPMPIGPVQVRLPNGVSLALGVETGALPGLLATLARL
jgi:hypothetical protein